MPFLDLGVIAAGGTANYDLTLTFTFSNATAFNNWQDFYLGGQGVQLVNDVPEPGSLALTGVALMGLLFVGKRRTR